MEEEKATWGHSHSQRWAGWLRLSACQPPRYRVAPYFSFVWKLPAQVRCALSDRFDVTTAVADRTPVASDNRSSIEVPLLVEFGPPGAAHASLAFSFSCASFMPVGTAWAVQQRCGVCYCQSNISITSNRSLSFWWGKKHLSAACWRWCFCSSNKS